MFMRVFFDEKRGIGLVFYVKVIEDVVKFGVDSINLSLGGVNGFLVNVDDWFIKVLEMVRFVGVFVVIVVGNDGIFGSGVLKFFVFYFDYGLIGSLLIVCEVIFVVLYNNIILVNKVFNIIGLENNKNFNNGLVVYVDFKVSDKIFEVGK